MNNFSVSAVEGPLYDNEIANLGAHFTQSSLYRSWQEKRNFEVERFVLKQNNEPLLFFQTITAPLAFGKNQIYIPHGPIALQENITPEIIRELKTSLKQIARVRRAIFVRFDPDQKISKMFNKYFTLSPKLAYHSTLTQPRYEWVMDISNDEKNLLEKLPKDTRYSIRTSQQRGAKVDIITENFANYLPDFCKLLDETGQRNGFRPHPSSYYELVLNQTEKSKEGFLVVVSFEEKPLVINLVTIFGSTALHVFGGSSSDHRNKLPSYLAHWAGFIEAKKRGATTYSFGGVSYGEDQKATWTDLTAFKKNFPGEARDFGHLYDLPISYLWYYLYILGKIFRQK